LSDKIAVIGLGNTLRKDDGIGILILDALRKSPDYLEVDYLQFGVMSIDLLYRIKEYKTVILIDGINAGLNHGKLRIFGLDEIEKFADSRIISSHELNLKTFINIYHQLNMETKVFIAGIQIENVGYGEEISASIMENFTFIENEISKFLGQLIKQDKPQN
jgi:hydrogenase maturation protease